ncbi:hypothetical protein NUM_44160 [Actinocatenispora comari]|uniref:Uncharacterized protein n=1 Tax=Actinocatenispora comari TaxID=2807577 RepID=A0A8J4AH72_9ACTN|nr:hypothetical protein NUM_44160 [Actinocatenispora comari]
MTDVPMPGEWHPAYERLRPMLWQWLAGEGPFGDYEQLAVPRLPRRRPWTSGRCRPTSRAGRCPTR